MSIIKKLFGKKEDVINELDLEEIFLLINPVFDNALGINYINFNNLKLYFKLIKIFNIKKYPMFFDILLTFNKFEFDEKVDQIQDQLVNIVRELYIILLNQSNINIDNIANNQFKNTDEAILDCINNIKNYWDTNETFIFLRKHFLLDLKYDLNNLRLDDIGINIAYIYKEI